MVNSKSFLCGLVMAITAAGCGGKSTSIVETVTDKVVSSPRIVTETKTYTITKEYEVIPVEFAREINNVLKMGIYHRPEDGIYVVAVGNYHNPGFLMGFPSLKEGLDRFTENDECGKEYPSTLILRTSETAPITEDEKLEIIRYFDIKRIAYVEEKN